MNLEPVGPSAITTTGLGHADREALTQPAGLAGGSVALVDDTAVVVLAVGDVGLVVAEAAEEALAALAGEGPEVEAGGLFLAHPAQLVLHRVQATLKLKKKYIINTNDNVVFL